MTIEEAAARLRKRQMLRVQPPIPDVPAEVGAPTPIAPRLRFAIYRITVDLATGVERQRVCVDTKQRYESAQGAALARNISASGDDIFVVVREEG